MARGGQQRREGTALAAVGLAVAATLGLPRLPASDARLPPPPPALELEGAYPSPLRTALELEPLYAGDAVMGEPAPAPHLLALTFDTEIPRGGEARQTVNEILDVLRAENVRATFFVVGTWARANADVLRRMAAEGHEIANHSFDHRPFARRRAGDLRADLDSVAAVVERETGTPIAPLFRPPYGCVDAPAAAIIAASGYTLAGWTAAGRDADGATASPLEVVEELEADLAPGAVVLLHTNRWITAAALPLILDRARAKGLAADTLSAVFERDGGRREEIDRRARRPCGTLVSRGGGGSRG